MTNALIIGAGIAGTAAALGLRKAGLDVTVYEAHPDSGADIGAFLTLADNGMRALAQLDAADAVAGVGFSLTSMSVVDHTGAEVASVPLGGHDNPLTHYRCLRRAELGDVLRAEVRRRGIPIRHGARFASLDDGVVRFTDGTTASGDVVIAADGLNSAVRPFIDPAVPRYAGQHVWYGYTTDARPPTQSARITMLRGSGSAFGYCVSGASETFWFARVASDGPLPAERIAETSASRWREFLLPVLSPDNTPAAGIVAATEQLMVTNAWDLPPGNRWWHGNTVLVGDAAHAASPATGQGASMALEDAVVLAKALRDSADVGAALPWYETLRRPRVERNIEVSAAATAGRPTGGPQRRTSNVDDELNSLLDWEKPLTASAEFHEAQ